MKVDLSWKKVESRVEPGVTYEIRPFRVWAFAMIQSIPREGDKLSFASAAQLAEMAGKVLPEHVRRLTGVTYQDDAGEHTITDTNLQVLGEEMAFFSLVAEMLSELTQISTLGKADAKN